ncbi:hypothetical protein GE115_14700 [Agromyces sp. CFH 90414]|uniref:Uncharacterized protein n=1 Tax=Agromyces agglutinans TaxID=2662258 RepID=A0A6I2FGP1_9MICO|nr:hypothetical protein [Agromyces agglutinans]MRG61103.1 hypothetical protein [Agromyces agglutinans]
MSGGTDASRAAGAPQADASAGGRAMDRIVRASFTTEESVYGVILVAGMIIVSASHASSSWQVFWTVLVTVIVFWAAHVYAGTVAHHGFADGEVVGIGEAFRIALHRSWGLLASAMIPSLILLAGATRVIDDVAAVWTALWSGVVVLAVLGWIAFARRGAAWPFRALGALATAGFGLVMILLKVLVH